MTGPLPPVVAVETARLEAMMRWLLDDGHMDPVATRQIGKILEACPEVPEAGPEPAVGLAELDPAGEDPDGTAASSTARYEAIVGYYGIMSDEDRVVITRDPALVLSPHALGEPFAVYRATDG